MAITKVDSFEIRSSTSANPSGSFTTAPATGDAVVCSCSGYNLIGGFTEPTDNKGNTYTRRGTATVVGDFDGDAFTSHNVTGGATFTVTIHKAEADSSANWISAWTGVSTSVTPTGTSATSTSASPSITSGTLGGESVVVAHCGHDVTDTTQTEPGSPWVLIGDEENFTLYTDNNCVSQVASSGTLTATWTLGGSRTWYAHQVTLEAAPAVVVTPPGPLIQRPVLTRAFSW